LATSADLSCAVEKAGAPFYFHTVTGAGHISGLTSTRQALILKVQGAG